MMFPLENSWSEQLADSLHTPEFLSLMNFLDAEYKSQTIFPPKEHLFAAFNSTPFNAVRVVILGQDPYHRKGQAHGLCFSVADGIKIPPSLKNIYKELHNDLHVPLRHSGDLTYLAKQGVLLLNVTLTVNEGNPGSHQGKGWEEFTDSVIAKLSDEKEGLVFLLWGAYAQKKGAKIDRTKHLVLEAPHPSPFSAHKGFFGCKHFSKTNAYLREYGRKEIDW